MSELTDAFEDPASLGEEFHLWALAHCIWRDRCYGGKAVLHKDFCQWLRQNLHAPCSRTTFDGFLADGGFSVSHGMVYGMVLKAELKAKPEPVAEQINMWTGRL